MDSNRSTQLGLQTIPRLLLSFSAPAIIGTMAQSLYVVIDRIFVGHAIGMDGIAGTTVALPPMLVVLAFGMLVGFGAAALISIRLGEQKKAEAEQILGNAVVLMAIVSLVVTVLGLAFLDRILVGFGASEKVLPYGRAYLGVILRGTVFQTFLFGLNAAIRGEGNPRIAMFSMLISVVLNVILAPLFLFTFHWGMEGAALATVCSQAVSAVWVVLYFLKGPSVLKFRVGNLRLDHGVCAAVFKVGLPAFVMPLTNSLLHCILNLQLHRCGGDTAMSIWGIIYPIIMMIAMPIIGLNQGAQPIIGYNYGAGRFDRVKRTLEMAILAATAVTVFGFFLSMVFPDLVIRLFIKDPKALPAILPLGVHAIRITTIMLPLVGFQIVSTGYFQAVGKPKQAMVLALSRQVFLLIPAILILPRFFGLDGLWASLPTADLGSSLWTGACLLFELRHLREKKQECAFFAKESN
jgi:putative MATE family efflux protein